MSLYQKFEESKVFGLRRICKECLEHYNPNDDNIHKYFDCKNVFYDKDKKQRGQCQCYSKEHGMREVERGGFK